MLFHGFAEFFGDAIGQTTDLHRFLKTSPFGNHIADFGKGAESWPGRYLGFGRTVINEERFGDGMTGIGYRDDIPTTGLSVPRTFFPGSRLTTLPSSFHPSEGTGEELVQIWAGRSASFIFSRIAAVRSVFRSASFVFVSSSSAGRMDIPASFSFWRR